jgi:hypothetical protein
MTLEAVVVTDQHSVISHQLSALSRSFGKLFYIFKFFPE